MNLIVRCDVDKTNEFDVFISYCHAQQKIVRPIADRLKKEGFKIWLDVEQVCTYQFGLLFHGTAHISLVISERECVMLETTDQTICIIFNIVSFNPICTKFDK